MKFCCTRQSPTARVPARVLIHAPITLAASIAPTALIALIALIAPNAAAASEADEVRLSIVRPGGGFLAADGVSIIPLEIVVVQKREENIRSAKITASVGKIANTRILGRERILFDYAVPARPQEAESLDVSLTLDGGERSEVFPIRVPIPAGPALELSVEPSVLPPAEREKTKVRVAATARGDGIEGVTASVSPGTLGPFGVTRIDGGVHADSMIEAIDLPLDAPGYILALAASASGRGWVVKTGGVFVDAPIRVSLDLPPRAVLSIEGTSNDPAPVTAPSTGPTIVENVLVRYGVPVRAFSEKDGRRTEIPLAIPSQLSAGAVAAIPGQAIADGGTGPTILVAAPPSPSGRGVIWPEIRVEGAELISMLSAARDVRALVLRRPEKPGTVTVLLDDQVAATFELTARRGETVQIASTYVKTGERGALEVVVKDSQGELTDRPSPRVWIEGGVELGVERQDAGRYRVSIPPSTGGPTGSNVNVIAEITPPPLLAGEPLESPRAMQAVRLVGPPPAIGLGEGQATGIEKSGVQESETADALRIGVLISALAGTTLNSLFLVGGSLLFELRLPFVEQRVSVRTGVELSRAAGSGTILLEQQALDSRTIVAAISIPIDVGFAFVRTDGFDLLLRAGFAARIEQGVIEVDGDSPGAGRRLGLGAQASLEADFAVGTGDLVLAATLGSIGANAEGLSTDRSQLSGGLTALRAEAGYRIWF